jgi:hypothetical protein
MARTLAADKFQVGVGGPTISAGTADPSLAPGVPAPKASQYFRLDGSRWAKIGDGDTEWLRSSFFTSSINGDSATIQPGMAVVLVGASGRRGNASSQALSGVTGIAMSQALVTLPLLVVTGSEIVLPTEVWDAVTGQVGGLTAGLVYWLGLTAGALTTTPPSLPGQSVCSVGRAISSTTFVVSPQPPILL